MSQFDKLLYPAVFHQESDGQFSVLFPDLDGCFANGDTFEDAYFNAQNMLAIYARYSDETLPVASSMTAIQLQHSNAQVVLIGADPNLITGKPKESIKKNLTLPKWLNDLAVKYEVNFSQVLKDALIQHLLQEDTLSVIDRKMLKY